LRVLKPGGHLAAFGAPRTFHRVACGIEDAGFQLRDTLMWVYGTGMPKSRRYPGGTGTSLKPAWEPILLARKPPRGTVKANAQQHGTGLLEIDACRGAGDRYPANMLLGHAPECTDTTCVPGCALKLVDETALLVGVPRRVSQLFYCPKASRKERDAGCDQLPAQILDLFPQRGRPSAPTSTRNAHPTVKPLNLMRWLVRLITPPDGLVLDPFCGSGSTGAASVLEHRRFLGVEREREYVEIARARIAHWNPEEQPPPEEGQGETVPFVSGPTGANR
jgi:DNA modification methylase